jgi:hypothetical protein
MWGQDLEERGRSFFHRLHRRIRQLTEKPRENTNSE